MEDYQFLVDLKKRCQNPEFKKLAKKIVGLKDKQVRVLDENFHKFWEAYPKKKSKGDAEKAWVMIDDLSQCDIIEAAKRLSAVFKDKDITFCPYPATWLRAKGWEDEDVKPMPTHPYSEEQVRQIKRRLERDGDGSYPEWFDLKYKDKLNYFTLVGQSTRRNEE